MPRPARSCIAIHRWYLTLLPLGCVLAVACGSGSKSTTRSASHAQAVAPRVCSQVRAATASRLGAAVVLRIADSDPTNIECVLHGRGVRVEVVSQPSVVAYTEFDTTSSHYSQVYGNGGAHNANDQPVPVEGVGVAAIWVAGEHQLVATTGSPGHGGDYVTVTLAGGRIRTPARLAVARPAARAALAATPGPQ